MITIRGYDFGDTRLRVASRLGVGDDWAKAVPVDVRPETPVCRLAPEQLMAGWAQQDR